MAGKATTERQGSGHTRKLSQRHLPFAGLLLMTPTTFAVGLILHFLLQSDVTRGLTACGVTVLTCLLAQLAHSIGAGRKPVVRWHVVATVALVGLGEAVTLLIGLTVWWTLTFLIVGTFVAASWSLYRIDAFRQRTDQPETEDTLRKELGLEGTRFKRPEIFRDKSGDVTRIEVPVTHAPGKTVEQVQAAVAGLESVAGAPRGRSRAVPDVDDASRSNLVIILKDVLATTVPWPGPSAPGTFITEQPLISGVHEDQQPLVKFIAGDHPDAPNPSSYAYMGMTRTGKTLNAQVNALEMFTRQGVCLMWFDTIKGAQTVQPIRDGLDIVVASDDPQTFRAGMKALMALVKWRANELGRHGFRAWNRKAAEALRMPLLVAHFEEADALCDLAPDEMVFLASKGLSTGVLVGISLQRADATSMPTGLRFNIGNWSVFGCGDSYSSGFALSDHTIAAGAHPENWKQSKPGYLYQEGIGIPEDRWPVTARSFYATDEEMAEHTAMWAPHMWPLDPGSVEALGSWYEAAKAEMADQDAVSRQAPIPAATSTNTRQATVTARVPGPTDTDPDAQTRAEIDEEIAEMKASGEIPAQLDPEADAIDPTQPLPPTGPGDELSWAPDKPSAKTPEEAAEAFDAAIAEIAADPDLRDPKDPSAVTFQVDTLVGRYKFRSRPWFSQRLTDCADGKITIPPGYALSRSDKPGHYRLQRLATVTALSHAG
jgi:hypothetical protein